MGMLRKGWWQFSTMYRQQQKVVLDSEYSPWLSQQSHTCNHIFGQQDTQQDSVVPCYLHTHPCPSVRMRVL